MTMSNSEYNVETAAILLMGMGEQHAAQILTHMEPKEVQSISAAMAELSDLNKDKIAEVMNIFLQEVENETGLEMGANKYIRSVLNTALGPNKANQVIERIFAGGSSTGLDSLKWMEPVSVADIIRFEHPQVQAIILSYLESDQAASVLSLFEEKKRLDLILRISRLESVQPLALEELNAIIEKQVTTEITTQTTSLGGAKVAANIMNSIDGGMEATLLEQITGVDAELCNNIQDFMFIFDNIVSIDDRGIQTLLKDISSDDLIIALKGAGEPARDKIFNNMSKRAAELLKDDLEAKGPVRLSEVEVAQKAIITVARRMADAGEISLGVGSGSDMMV